MEISIFLLGVALGFVSGSLMMGISPLEAIKILVDRSNDS